MHNPTNEHVKGSDRLLKPVVEIQNLSIHSSTESIVSGLSLTLLIGKPLTILGETGSGKSLLAQAIMGALPAELSSHGNIKLFSRDDHSKNEVSQLWGRRIAMLPQEPWLSLDPIMRGEKQLALVEQLVNGKPEAQSKSAALKRLAKLELGHCGTKIPSHLSGGMAQRLAYLCATAAGAEVLIADEPTKGLDTSRKSQIIELLKRQGKKGALLTITHDIAVAEALKGELIIMRQGVVVEKGTANDILQNPSSDYTRKLIAAYSPEYKKTYQGKGKALVVAAHGLSKHRGGRKLFSNLDLSITEGEIVGLSGVSGAGKSTLADILLRLTKADEGAVKYSSALTKGKALKLYQDPPAAFPQSITLEQHLEDLCKLHNLERKDIPYWLAKLRLDTCLLRRKPSQLSGGELQRFALLRALMMNPKFLVADEPTSRLDPIVASETLSLLIEHTQRIGCALVLISHDQVALEQICNKVIKLDDQPHN